MVPEGCRGLVGPLGVVARRVGAHDHELGILDLEDAPRRSGAHGQGGSVTYWQVDDADAALTGLLARGATVHEEIRDFGGGYRGAGVIDPFGNALGIMQRPAVPTAAAPETNGEAA